VLGTQAVSPVTARSPSIVSPYARSVGIRSTMPPKRGLIFVISIAGVVLAGVEALRT